MCYLASDLAVHHGQMEVRVVLPLALSRLTFNTKVARLFTDLERQGPPRQKVLLKYGNAPEKEFIMANSAVPFDLLRLTLPPSFSPLHS